MPTAIKLEGWGGVRPIKKTLFLRLPKERRRKQVIEVSKFFDLETYKVRICLNYLSQKHQSK